MPESTREEIAARIHDALDIPYYRELYSAACKYSGVTLSPPAFLAWKAARV